MPSAAFTVHIYGDPQVQYSSDMHIATLPSCFSSLLGWALFGSSEHLKHISEVLYLWATVHISQNAIR